MAQTLYSQCLSFLRDCIPSMELMDYPESRYCSAFIGSYMLLDPCGRYHHCLSPNRATSRCQAYWDALEKAAGRLGGWIESGEGDPTDMFFCLPADDETER